MRREIARVTFCDKNEASLDMCNKFSSLKESSVYTSTVYTSGYLYKADDLEAQIEDACLNTYIRVRLGINNYALVSALITKIQGSQSVQRVVTDNGDCTYTLHLFEELQ